MNTRLIAILAGLGASLITALSTSAAPQAASLEPLSGRWSVSKINREGRSYSQEIEIKERRLTFRILDADQQLRMVAQATVKSEKAGPFDVLVLSEIRGGRSMESMESVDDERVVVYALREGELFIAANFDRDRGNEKPTADTYVRKETARPAATPAAEGEAKVLGLWKMEVTLGDTTRDYQLRLAKTDGSLQGVLISPRSGEYKCKSVEWKNGELTVEVQRDIEGNQATFVYRGQPTADGLSGTVTIKGYEDRFTGRWKASK